MSHNTSSEAGPIMSAHANNIDTESETRILTTQVEIDEQISFYIALLTRQLEDLRRLIHEMVTTHRPSFSPRAGNTASSRAASPSPDIESC